MAQTGKSEIISDTQIDSRYIVDDLERNSEMAVPIIHKKVVIGVIDSENSETNFYTKDHLHIVESIANLASVGIMNAVHVEELKLLKNNLEKTIEKRTEELKSTISQLQTSNENLEFFIHTASQNLREPLKTISTYSSLLEKDENVSAETRAEYFSYIRNSSESGLNLLTGLLDYENIRLEKRNVSKGPVSISRIIEELLHSDFRSKRLKINNHVRNSRVYGSEHLLKMLFKNLLSQGIKSSSDDHLRIEIRERSLYGKKCFLISDNGLGYKRFVTLTKLDSANQFGREKITLAICKKVVEFHGGQIKMKSSGINTGTRYIFTLEQ